MRTVEEFKKQAKLKNITKVWVHDCSICKYPCGYIINNDATVTYDSGCDCVSYHGYRPSSFDEVASFYNIQTDEKVIQEMDEFWGFE